MSDKNRIAIGEIAKLATKVTGVQFSDRHHAMIASRLYARINELEIKSVVEYLAHLQANFDTEKKYLVSLLTTHHTYFFRELPHFEFLNSSALKETVLHLKKTGRDTLKIWSAACSRGHEVYSLAMWILPWLEKNAPEIKLSILGTDIDPESVKVAQNGVYNRDELSDAPLALIGNHWSRGTGDIANFVRAKDSLRSIVKFRSENLLDLSPSSEKFDLIFCRNVFIYFNPEQITKITTSLLERLNPEGYLFIGISESLNGLKTETRINGPSIYRHKKLINIETPRAETKSVKPIGPDSGQPIRVICVDDSPTILAILKRILVKDSGFEVVATASSGLDLELKLKDTKADLITLDIHMPEMDGIEYLRKNWNKSHPPVVMISSVSRDNADLALNALKLGASDYIEKPSLGNIALKTEEIHSKLKSVFEFGHTQLDKNNSVSFQQFSLTENPDHSLRIIPFTLGSREKVVGLCRNITPQSAPTILLLEAPALTLASITPDLELAVSKNRLQTNLPTTLNNGEFYLLDFESGWAKALEIAKKRSTALLLPGKTPASAKKLIEAVQNIQILFEDRGKSAKIPTFDKSKCNEAFFIPLTSFLYQSAEYFTKSKKAA